MSNYKVIKSIEQYHKYCEELESLTCVGQVSSEDEENIDLLTVLIEKWDEDNYKSNDVHPVVLLKQLMENHDLNAAKLSKNTGIDKTVLSKIINNKKGFSKEVIRILSDYFKVNQEAFNKPYVVNGSDKTSLLNYRSTLSPIIEADKGNTVEQDIIKLLPAKRSISMAVTTFELISKEDQEIILYIPTLKLVGKANTLDLANDRLDEAANKFLRELLKLPFPKISAELKKLGWEQNKYKKRSFSKSYVDKDGGLRDFEIPVEDRIVQKSKELFTV